MWQRIQTVFLVITILSVVTAIFLPIYIHTEANGNKHTLYAMQYIIKDPKGTRVQAQYFPYSLISVLLIAAATLSFMEIRKFRNRILQVKLGALNSAFLALAVGAAVYFATNLLKANQGGGYGFGLWVPFIGVVCNWLAIRFIKRDEKMVRDSDRLR
jgi:hypothetical protein